VKLSVAQMALMSRLLDEALPLALPERSAWLERLPPEHEPLRAALRDALFAQAAAVSPVDALPPLGTAEDLASDLSAGMRIGPYELIRPLGVGGMGEVWLARRADGAFRREVALKLPRQRQLDDGVTQRFAQECNILAGLEHPLIARLYDAGRTEGGRPYLAMEYVGGEPITSWCDRQQLVVMGRVELFQQVLEAVQFAHGKGIVHRDIKPSNILVTDAGQTRLLDFGIAKLLADQTGGSGQLTGLYGRALTPDYASPELLRGDALDVRSDLYSLGVVLYELLSGCRPYRLQAAAARGLLDRAADALDPAPPSLRVEAEAARNRASSVSGLQRALGGDLDAIVLKALAREPALRYQSAAAFTQDLNHYRNGKPIQARPARVIDRATKFVRRNRTLVAAGVLALIAMLASLGYAFHRERIMQVGVTGQASAFAPSPHSIAVLPFANLSGEKEQEYFSDGLTEELQNALASIENLQVAGRTSSFYFKGKDVDLGTIARRLNVGAVLEGSVRRSGNTVRVSAQLTNAVTGFRLWSRTYDGDLGDVLGVQTQIATAVAGALRVALVGDVSARIELGGTRNPAAFDAYLRGRRAQEQDSADSYQEALAAYTQAIYLDAHYALAFAERSLTHIFNVGQFVTGPTAIRGEFERADQDARQALILAPELAEGHMALGEFLSYTLHFAQAQESFERARALAPSNAQTLRESGRMSVAIGSDTKSGLAALWQAARLDPMNAVNYFGLGEGLYNARQFQEAEAAETHATGAAF